MIITSEFALLPDTDVMVPTGGPTMTKGYDRRIPGATKARELGMMAEHWDNPAGRFDGFADLKVDGWRAIFLGGEAPRIVTREGEPLLAADHILPTLCALEALYGEPMMLDGEFAAPGGLDATIAAGRRGAAAPDLSAVIWLFDAVPLSVWASGQPYTVGAWERREGLLRRARHVKRPNVGVLRPELVSNADRVDALGKRVWSMGGEGLVVKLSDSTYRRERSDAWRKVKQRDELTVQIADVNAKGRLVGLSRHGTRFAIATGYTQETLDLIKLHRDRFVGKEAVIEATGFTGSHTPKHARFVRMVGAAR